MTADSPTFTVAPARKAPRRLDWPGARTFRSAGFRVLVAGALWLVGAGLLGMILVRQAADPAGQYAFDFATYHAAALDLAAGRSPYSPEMFDGPLAAQGPVGATLYKYPPLFAQALLPLGLLPLEVAAAAWLVLQAAMLLAGVWIALVAGGARRNLETLCWAGVATTFFLPAFDTLWKGNVSGLLALLVALTLRGGAVGGAGAALAALVKTTPLVLLAPVVGRRGDALRGALVLAPVVLVSVALAPAAWLDFARVLPNLAGPARYPTNLALDNIAAFLMPSGSFAVGAARAMSVALGAGALVGAVLVARRSDGWPAAVVLAVAALLLLPNATWYHYLAVLLPVAAFSWPRAGRRARVTLIAGAAMVSLALLWLPLAALGGATMAAASLAVVWPRSVGRVLAHDTALRVRAFAERPDVRRRVLAYLSLAGYALGLAAGAVLVLSNGGIGYDAHAYWLAGRNVLEGQALYWPHDEGALGAFRYPPLFAQLWAPFSLLPALAFSWLWRLVCFAALRYLAGSWRNVGLWLLVPFVWTELSIANVTFPVAALCLLALRGQAAGVAWAGALKFGPLLIAPYIWLRRPEARRSLVIGAAALLAATGVSVALAPDAWATYLQALTWMGGSSTESFGVVSLLGHGLLDAALHMAIGAALVVAALWRGSDRLAFAATVVAVPVLAIWRLTPLLALPRIGRGR